MFLSHPCHHPEDKSSLTVIPSGWFIHNLYQSQLPAQGAGHVNPRAAVGERQGQFSSSHETQSQVSCHMWGGARQVEGIFSSSMPLHGRLMVRPALPCLYPAAGSTTTPAVFSSFLEAG